MVQAATTAQGQLVSADPLAGRDVPAAWRRGWRAALAVLVALLAGMAGVEAAVPEVGKVLADAVEVRFAKRLPLPPGRWRVESTFEETTALDNPTGRRSVPVHTVVLTNEEPNADLAVIIFEFTDSASVNWTGQPCDDAPGKNPPLLTNKLDTTASTLRVRCNRIYALNLRGIVQGQGNTWYSKRFEKLQPRAASFPVHGLMASGYASAPRGDRVSVWVYPNPAAHGLDGVANVQHLFRSTSPGAPNAAAVAEYLKAFSEWFDGYTNAIDNAYLSGNSPGSKAAAAFRYGKGGAASTQSAAAPAATAAPPATVPRVAIDSPQAATAPAAVVAPAVPPPPRQKVHALVVGNGAYSMAKLANPRNDAQAVAERFRRFGFEVSTVLDATRKQLVDALTRFGDSARDADVSIVFYAGHGVQVNGVNYLIPVDLDLAAARAVSVAYDAVSLNALLENHLPGRAKLVFLDACRDNPLARSLGGTRGSAAGLAAVNAAAGTLISYATRDGSTASDGAGQHSPYTAALLAHLDENEDISIVLRRVRQRVMSATKGTQQPWEYGSLVGDKLVLSQISRPR